MLGNGNESMQKSKKCEERRNDECCEGREHERVSSWLWIPDYETDETYKYEERMRIKEVRKRVVSGDSRI